MKRLFTYLLLSTFAIACHVDMPHKPVANFSFMPANGCKAPCTVTFTSEAENAESIVWDFGDGSEPQSGESITHKFDRASTYQVKMSIKGVDGGSSGITQAVDIDTIGPVMFTGGYNFATDIVSDDAGNIYISGTAKGEVDFGDGFKMKSVGKDDFFVAKYNSMGRCLWLYTDGSAEDDHANALVFDKKGKLYLTGFVSGEVKKSPMVPTGSHDGFIAKLDASTGNLEWFKTFGGTHSDQGRSVAFYQAGEGPRVFLVGRVEGDTLGTQVSFNGAFTTKVAGHDGFFSIVDGLDGSFIKVAMIDGKGTQIPESVTVDNVGNAYIAGKFDVSAHIPDIDQTFESIAKFDIFVAKYGLIPKRFLWANRLASVGDDYVGDIIVNANKDVFVTGMHDDNLKEIPLPSSGDSNVFLAKWNTNGDPITGKGGFTDGTMDYYGGIALSNNGNIVLAGSYTGNGWFPMSSGQKQVFQGDTDVLVTEVDPTRLERASNFIVREGGNREDRVNAICVTKSGYVYVTGWSYGSPTYRGVTINGEKEARQTFIVRYKL